MSKRKKAPSNAVSYLRVSGRGQIRGDGFPRQREVIRRYASRHRMKLLDEFQDRGVSGTKDLEHRSGLAALLDRVETNGIKTVLVERADRLARDLLVGEVILSQFREAGVRVIAADSGTELTTSDDDPTRKLIRQVLGAVAEFEKSVLVLKLRAARERIRRSGRRCEGKTPYGAKPGEAQVVALIRKLRRKPRNGTRMSCAKVADELNSRGIPTRQGGPWKPGTIWSIERRLKAR